jgi:hypothetical protein
MGVLAVFPLYFQRHWTPRNTPLAFEKANRCAHRITLSNKGKHAPVPKANADQGKIVSIVCKPD